MMAVATEARLCLASGLPILAGRAGLRYIAVPVASALAGVRRGSNLILDLFHIAFDPALWAGTGLVVVGVVTLIGLIVRAERTAAGPGVFEGMGSDGA